MFLCDKCAPKHGVSDFEVFFGERSRGECEGCGTVSSCVDAHWFENAAQQSVQPTDGTVAPANIDQRPEVDSAGEDNQRPATSG